MKILVTGAAGFIGSNLVEMLIDKGHDVVGIDNFTAFYDPQIKERNLADVIHHDRFQLYRTDIVDRAGLDYIFADHDFDVIVHLAAKAGVRPSIEIPGAYFRTNLEGTINLLELCKKKNIRKFVFASSSSVYGNNKKVPFSETDNVDFPISPYAASKKSGELICHNYHHHYGIHIYALRFFTVYGPRQRPEMAIHKFTRAIDAGKTLPVYGEGKPKRDFTYISDILDGIYQSILRVEGFEIFNLGESQTTTVNELITQIEEALGKKAKREYLPMQPGDVIETFADIDKARKLLDYNPNTDIQTGIRKFVRWYLEYNSI